MLKGLLGDTTIMIVKCNVGKGELANCAFCVWKGCKHAGRTGSTQEQLSDGREAAYRP
jgi:hypothetical protein